MELKDKIKEYRDDICRSLVDLIKIPSVAGTSSDDMPYGENSAKALNFMLDLAKDMGFKVKNYGNHAGHAEYGEGR